MDDENSALETGNRGTDAGAPQPVARSKDRMRRAAAVANSQAERQDAEDSETGEATQGHPAGRGADEQADDDAGGVGLTLLSDSVQTEQPQNNTPLDKVDDDFANILSRLKAKPPEDWVVLIIGYSDAGKSFFVDQAKELCGNFFSATAPKVLVSDGIRLGGGAGSTKDIERTIFSRTNPEDRTCRAPTFWLVDIPGEWFGNLIGVTESGNTAEYGIDKLLRLTDATEDRLRQLMAAVAIADAVVLVLNGPAAVQSRARRTPEKVGGETGNIGDLEWRRLTDSVTRSIDLLFPLSSFLRVVSEAAQPGLAKLAAFERLLSWDKAKLQDALTRGNALCPTPLFVTMTKADQIFGCDADEEDKINIEIRAGTRRETVVLDGADPWISLLRANATMGNRDPYSRIVRRFRTVNLDFSSASPGGAQERTTDGKAEFKIRDGYLGEGRGISEAIYWLLDSVADQKEAARLAAEGKAKFWKRWLTPSGLRQGPPFYSSAIARRRDLDREFRKLTK